MATVTPLGEGAWREPKPMSWEGMRFRSSTEYRLTRAFDRTGIMVMPNARGRIGSGPRRCTREIDLLVNIDGWWAAIEIDGAPFHPPERAAEDHRRDRLLRSHGLSVERYDSEFVYARPELVVAEIVAIAQAARRASGWSV